MGERTEGFLWVVAALLLLSLAFCSGCVRQIRVQRDDQDVTLGFICIGLGAVFLRADDDAGHVAIEAEAVADELIESEAQE